MPMPPDMIAKVAKEVELELPGVAPGLGEEEYDDGEEGAAGNAEVDEEGAEAGEEVGQEGEGDRAAGAPDTSDSPAGEDASASPDGEPAASESDLAQRLASIAEAEDEIRVTSARVKRQQAELEERFKKFAEQQKSSGDLAQQFKHDPFGTMERLGVPFDQLLEAVAQNEGEIPRAAAPAQKTEEIPTWAQELLDWRKEQQEQSQKNVQQEQIAAGERHIQGLIDTELGKDSYSLLKAVEPDPKATIWGIIRTHAYQTGELLSIDKVAATLQGEWQQRIADLPNHEETRKLLNLAPPAASPKTPKKPGRQSGDLEPEQNSLSSDMPPSKRPKKKPATRDEMIRDAARNLDVDVWEPYPEDEED